MLFGKKGGLLVVATLSAHGDGSVQIKLQVSWRHNELFQLLDIL